MAYVEIIIAAAAAFLLGFGWYTVLFGKTWQIESGITEEEAQKNIARTHGLAFLMMCIIAYSINIFIGFHELKEQTFTHGAFHGMLSAVLYAIPALAIHYLYQRKSLKLFLIDAGYLLAFFALMGGILAALKLGVA